MIMDLYVYSYDPSWRGIINPRHTQENPYLFIFGASYVYPINSTYVSEYLVKNSIGYDVYNLADMSDTPSHRLKSLEHVISLKPKVILYGVSITDFAKSLDQADIRNIESKDEIAETLNPKKEIAHIISTMTQNSFEHGFPTSPKERTILSLKYLIRGPEFTHNPFINFKTIPITDEKTFASSYKFEFGGVDTSYNNKERIALEKIISELKKNNIKVILFTVPHHKVFLDSVGDSNQTVFESTMLEIAKQNDVSLYFLHDRYERANIWRDPHHVAVNMGSIIYSDDIADILVEELEN
jgi:hypothetical protein